MNQQQRTVIAAGAITVVLLIVGVWLMPMGLRAAPMFSAQALGGRAIALDHWRGKPVLVTFWATSCPSCVAEIPHLVALHAAFASKGLEMVSVAMSYDPPAHVQAMVAQKHLPYPIVLDSQGTIAKAFDDVRLTPTTVLIDPNGQIAYYQIGLLDLPKVHALITEMLPLR